MSDPYALAAFIAAEMERGASQPEAIALAAAMQGRPITHAEVTRAASANPKAFPQAIDYKRLIR